MGGDYRRDGGRKRKRPPTIATFSKRKLDFFHFDCNISILCIAICHTEVLKCSCLYKLVNDVPVNPSDVALNFLPLHALAM